MVEMYTNKAKMNEKKIDFFIDNIKHTFCAASQIKSYIYDCLRADFHGNSNLISSNDRVVCILYRPHVNEFQYLDTAASVKKHKINECAVCVRTHSQQIEHKKQRKQIK